VVEGSSDEDTNSRVSRSRTVTKRQSPSNSRGAKGTTLSTARVVLHQLDSLDAADKQPELRLTFADSDDAHMGSRAGGSGAVAPMNTQATRLVIAEPQGHTGKDDISSSVGLRSVAAMASKSRGKPQEHVDNANEGRDDRGEDVGEAPDTSSRVAEEAVYTGTRILSAAGRGRGASQEVHYSDTSRAVSSDGSRTQPPEVRYNSINLPFSQRKFM